MKKILIDTNAYSNLLRGDNNVLEFLQSADLICFSIFVIAELLEGFKGGKKEQINKKILNKFLSKPNVEILNTSNETADIYSDIKVFLKKTGKAIPINDIWIAAHAIESASVLLTYDSDFKNIPLLRYHFFVF